MNERKDENQNEQRTQPTREARPEAGADAQREVIAHRRSCDVEGTGLSHYVLLDEKTS